MMMGLTDVHNSEGDIDVMIARHSRPHNVFCIMEMYSFVTVILNSRKKHAVA